MSEISRSVKWTAVAICIGIGAPACSNDAELPDRLIQIENVPLAHYDLIPSELPSETGPMRETGEQAYIDDIEEGVSAVTTPEARGAFLIDIYCDTEGKFWSGNLGLGDRVFQLGILRSFYEPLLDGPVLPEDVAATLQNAANANCPNKVARHGQGW